MSPEKILVVDDKLNMLKLFLRMLRERYSVRTAESAEAASSAIDLEEPDLIVTDVRMPGKDGLAFFRDVRVARPEIEFVFMTAFATIEQAVEAMREGAFYYLTKPFEPHQILQIVDRALERRRLRRRAIELQAQVDRSHTRHIVGESEPIQGVLNLVDRVAESDATVLIAGESGTGKELVARAIHARSPRAERRFVGINCAAIPEGLMEAELFGHARGAFTGSAGLKKGLIEEADGGTLFLDEISELPIPLQVKLTRTIQEREVRRIGETTDRKVDVRLIAASNRDLEEMVSAGRFREDLFFRLNVYPISIPPLRERAGDLALLVAHFIGKLNEKLGRNVEKVDDAALAALERYRWPGNVRELENVVERAILLSDGKRLVLEDFPQLARASGPSVGLPPVGDQDYRDYLDTVTKCAQRHYVEELLGRHEGNVTRAAAAAGVERETLHRIIRKLGLAANAFRPRNGDDAA